MQLGNSQLGAAQLGGAAGLGGGGGGETKLFSGEAWVGALTYAELDVNRSFLRTSQHAVEVWETAQASPINASQLATEAWGNQQASPVNASQVVLEVFAFLEAPVSFAAEAWVGGLMRGSLESMLFFAGEAQGGALTEAVLNQRFPIMGEVWGGALAEARAVQTHALHGEVLAGALTEGEKPRIFNTFFGQALGGALTEPVPAFTVFKYWDEGNALGGALARGIIDFVSQVTFCIEVVPDLVAVSSVIPLMPVAFIVEYDKLVAGVELGACTGARE